MSILGFKAILKTKTPRALISGLGILWFINIFIGLGSGFSYAKSFKHPYETSSNLNYFENINPDTLTLDANEEDGFSDFEFDNINLGFLKTKNDRFYSSDIRVKILKSDVPNILGESTIFLTVLLRKNQNPLQNQLNIKSSKMVSD